MNGLNDDYKFGKLTTYFWFGFLFFQQEDLVSLGKVVLALACNSVIGIQREHIQTSMELVARNYSADLKNLIL